MGKLLKRIVGFVLSTVMVFSMAAVSLAAPNDVIIITDDATKRVAKSGNVIATYDKQLNTMTINEGGRIYSYSLENVTENPTTRASIVKNESVALHRYQYNRGDDGVYYWAVDIPSYDINPNNWCGWITVVQQGTTEWNYAEEFADYIDAAQDDEHTIATYGGATAVAVIVGLVTKDPTWSSSAFEAACAAAGVVVGMGILDAASSYYNNLDNARENYFAIREIIG